jgi:hypothetical protein
MNVTAVASMLVAAVSTAQHVHPLTFRGTSQPGLGYHFLAVSVTEANSRGALPCEFDVSHVAHAASPLQLPVHLVGAQTHFDQLNTDIVFGNPPKLATKPLERLLPLLERPPRKRLRKHHVGERVAS